MTPAVNAAEIMLMGVRNINPTTTFVIVISKRTDTIG